SLRGPRAGGPQFRLRLTPNDVTPANDAKVFIAPAPAALDLAANSLTVLKIGGTWYLRGFVKNNGPAAYVAGRTYSLKKFGGGWITLSSAAVPGIGPGGSTMVQVALGPV